MLPLTHQTTAISQLAQAICDGVDLDKVLQLGVEQLQATLQTSCCLIWWAEGRSPPAPPISAVNSRCCLDSGSYGDRKFDRYRAYLPTLKQGIAIVLPCLEPHQPIEMQKFAQAVANSALLIVPFCYQKSYLGSIILHQCDRPRNWTDAEVALVQTVGCHCAIAIHQADLHRQVEQERQHLLQQVQQHNQTRADQVAERTAALAQTNEQLWLFVEHSPAAIAMFDREMRYLFYSHRWLQDYGAGEPDLTGRSHYEIAPDLPDRWRQTHQNALAGAVERCEEDCVKGADGALIWQKWEVRPWYTNDGAIGGIIIFVEAITEQKRVEAALRESEIRLRLALDAAHLGAWDYNLLTGEEIWSAKAEEIFGFAPGMFDDNTETFLNRVHPDDRDRVRNSHDCALETGVSQFEFRVIHPDNTLHWIASRGQVYYDKMGQPVRMSGIDMDITQLKVAEEQLKASLQEKNVLLQEIHHRVKNNLQTISSLLKLQAAAIQDPETLQLFQESQHRVQTMALIHEQLYQSPNLAQIDFATYVKKLTTHLLQSYAVNPQVVCLRLDIAPLELAINLAIPCGLIINELLTNIFKYAFPDGLSGEVKIKFTTDSSGNCVLIVSDNGIGLPSDLNPANLRSLGMRLVYSLTRQLRGKTELDRTQGTTFKITFCISDED